MSTEDDTFDALRRIPFDQMMSKMVRAKIGNLFGNAGIDLDNLCRINGWTLENYQFRLNEHLSYREGIIMKPSTYEHSVEADH